jgi:predicted nucleic acid-binding protein
VLYLDTSATAKLLIEEAESKALGDHLRSARTLLVTSRVGIVELRRVGRRIDAGADRADAIAASLVVVELDETVERHAIAIDPDLCCLDAIHLATALAAADSIDGFVCYDGRLAAAATALGLTVLAPA